MSKKKVLGKLKALYIRVSTDAQAEEGYSIQAQIERLEAYCKAMGWDEYGTYVDGGYSGSNLNRPEMTKLIADVEAGKISAVIVFKLDRLSRSQKDTLFLIEDVFLPNNVDFISLNESIDTSTPYGRAMIGILSAFAQLERENIYLRTRMGMLERVKQGLWMGGGIVPFGYDYDRNLGYLVPNEDAATVRKCYELYIKGYAPQKIANMLGLKYDKLVTQILTRRSNLGYIVYKGQEYKGQHEAIISEDTFNLAMSKMKERSKVRAGVTTNYHLLTGLVFCGDCGNKMRYVKWGTSGYKLVCYTKDKSKPYMSKGKTCNSENIWADQIEKIVLDDLFKISADMNDGEIDLGAEFVNPIDELEQQIAQLTNKLKRLYNLYGDSNDEVLFEAINENKETLAQLQAELEHEKKTHISNERLELVKLQVNSIAEAWELMTQQERQTIIRDCVDKVVITGDRVEIFYSFLIRETAKKAA